VNEGHWNRCLIAATGGFLLENMFFGRKKLILLAILVGVLRIERKSPELGNRTLTTEQG
jgi:hypothetical protein